MPNDRNQRATLFSRMAEGLWSFLEWPYVRKTAALLIGHVAASSLIVLFIYLLAKSPEIRPAYFEPTALLILVRMHAAYCLGLLVLLGVVLFYIRRGKESAGLAYLAIIAVAAEDALLMCSLGHATTPLPFLFLFLMASGGLLLFDVRFCLAAVFSWVAVQGVYIWLEESGRIPYAWALSGWPVKDGVVDNVWLGLNLIVGGVVTAGVLLVFGFALARWRDREGRVVALSEDLQEANQALQQSLNSLKATQGQLIEAEKMAALGNLVAGVAHEVNTPVGVAVTAASHLEERTQTLSADLAAGSLKKSDLEKYTKQAGDSAAMILSNLRRAGDIIQSFKQVAVDQSSEEKRRFNFKDYLEDVLLSLHPTLKKTNFLVEVDCPEDLVLESFPGAVSQIVTNLVMNSLVHGFEGRDKGSIRIEVSEAADEITFKYRDDGRGMDPESLKRIFEPFYTTKRTEGGSGLGMHIVYNLVLQTLGGRIEADSALGEGIYFAIHFPKGGAGHA